MAGGAVTRRGGHPLLLFTAAARRPCATPSGVPQTRCGLDAAFSSGSGAAFSSAGAPLQPATRGATRAPGEPAWHRRARRARAEARVVLRLDAARNRLASHHSAPHSNMLRRGGGGGIGGGGNVRAARQLLLQLLDGAIASDGQGNRRGFGGGARGGGRAGPGARPREGEWSCPCGFGTNRPYRDACFACGRPRYAGATNGEFDAKGKGGSWLAGGAGHKGERPFSAKGGHQMGGGPRGRRGRPPAVGGPGGTTVGENSGREVRQGEYQRKCMGREGPAHNCGGGESCRPHQQWARGQRQGLQQGERGP